MEPDASVLKRIVAEHSTSAIITKTVKQLLANRKEAEAKCFFNSGRIIDTGKFFVDVADQANEIMKLPSAVAFASGITFAAMMTPAVIQKLEQKLEHRKKDDNPVRFQREFSRLSKSL